ncbi:DUF1993 family protein [Silicimonas algicola]|uniref:DUF1993 family protein n=1 Tax=Silicimonas algicola TaxID=1826607 RepID=A0A316G4A5_9RHOB|nr:DUF1993 family protein [Silicimonas algicola]AZQ68530.1 DUF1993 family protein [Silicimonas algicola]PWK55761.1 hypothetical protein C8D95_106157 [Silicimonas algicola]
MAAASDGHPPEYGEAVTPALVAIGRALHLLARTTEAGREDLLSRSLAPGMFDCGTQLRTVGIFALRSTFTLLGRDWPRDIVQGGFADGAEGLEARLRLAAEQVRSLDPADFTGAFGRTVDHIAGDAALSQDGDVYLRLFALPNLWFHLSMAFAILRAEGLDVGKSDFDGWHSYAPGFSFSGR